MTTKNEPQTIILKALGWILEDKDRAERFLELTGLEPSSIRNGLLDPSFLSAVIEFLSNYEPDLLGASKAIEVAPEELINAGKDVQL